MKKISKLKASLAMLVFVDLMLVFLFFLLDNMTGVIFFAFCAAILLVLIPER